jgi:hypothetical protein
VVGAGASVEVGLPMGSALLEQIVQLTHYSFDFSRLKTGDNTIFEALKISLNEGREVDKLNEHLRAARQLGQSAQQALSIDNVIDALEDPKVELVGKMGIVRAILKAESASQSFKHPDHMADSLDLTRFKDSWYSSLTKLLTENIRRSEIGSIFDNLTIINFNYDRCLEHYLPISLSSYYGLPVDEIREVMANLPIYRPYGVAGRLPWQRGEAPSVHFGACSPGQLAQVVQQVRTFTERVEEGAELQQMRQAVAEADRIVFLGFAFHRQNVELIANAVQDHTEIVATAYAISASDKSVIHQELERAFEFSGVLNDGRVELADMTCAQFFREYWRTLTADKNDREAVEIPSYADMVPNYGNPKFGR